jgi:DNA-binding MarR family transcriptional regulator
MVRPNSTELPNIPPDTNRPPTGDEIDAVVDGYDRLMHRLVQAHAPEFTEVGVTMAQAKVLYVVMAAGRLHLTELASRLGIGTSSASEIAERLVELGLLDRAADASDRRQVVLTTTPAAVALLERFRELNQRELRDLLAHLDGGELDVIARSLDIFGRAIDRRTATTSTMTSTATATATTVRQGEPRT